MCSNTISCPGSSRSGSFRRQTPARFFPKSTMDTPSRSGVTERAGTRSCSRMGSSSMTSGTPPGGGTRRAG